MKALNLNYVAKEVNPPNAPQIRPIEQYWSILKQKTYENNWTAPGTDALAKIIKKCMREIEPNLYQRLFSGLKTKIRRAHDYGLSSLI